MSSFKQGMFRKIHNSDRKRMLQSMGQHRVPLSVKTDDDEIFDVLTTGLESDQLLRCQLILGSKMPMSDQSVVVNFTFGYERYFFQGFLVVRGEQILVDASGDFYILQRRKAARMIMPPDYPCGFNIIRHQDKAVFYEMKVVDFSSGGLKAYYPYADPGFFTNEKVGGVLHLGKRRPINIECLLRHVQKRTSGPKPGQVIGVQFDNMNRIMELKLLTIFMDVSREVFINYSKG